jgi:hypothetical protein
MFACSFALLFRVVLRVAFRVAFRVVSRCLSMFSYWAHTDGRVRVLHRWSNTRSAFMCINTSHHLLNFTTGADRESSRGEIK